MRTIRGKKALVTGAAAGLGRAIAIRLAREGADVAVLDVDREKLEETRREVEELDVETISLVCDLTDRGEIAAAAARLLAEWGHVDILVNNAGVGFYGPTETMTADQWDWLMAINVHAPIHLTRELLPTLLERPEAHIVNMASICGLVAGGRFCAYHTSKFAIVGFTEALRAEYGRQGLGVTCVCPGPVRTGLYRASPCGHTHKKTPEPPRWICTTPQHVAAAVVRGIYRDSRMIVLTPLAKMLFVLKRLTPGLLDTLQRFGRGKRLRKKAAKFAKRQQQKAGESAKKAA